MTTFELPTEEDLRPPPPPPPAEVVLSEEKPSQEFTDEELEQIPLSELWEDLIFRPDLNDLSPELIARINEDWPRKKSTILRADSAWLTLAEKYAEFEKTWGVHPDRIRAVREKTLREHLFLAGKDDWTTTLEQPWLQLVTPDGRLEPDKGFAAFTQYLTQGIHRNLKRACIAANNNKYDGSLYLQYQTWCSQWSWNIRCEAYDRYVASKQADAVATVKAQAAYKMNENLLKLAEYNSAILSDGITPEIEKVAGALAITRQNETIDQATRLYTALFGSKQEVKSDVSVNLAHAILTAPPHTIDI